MLHCIILILGLLRALQKLQSRALLLLPPSVPLPLRLPLPTLPSLLAAAPLSSFSKSQPFTLTLKKTRFKVIFRLLPSLAGLQPRPFQAYLGPS